MLAMIVRSASGRPCSIRDFLQRWFAWPNIVLASPVPILVLLVSLAILARLSSASTTSRRFFARRLGSSCAIAGLGISIWPMIVPPSITIWDAAAPPESQLFLLVGAAVLIPIILAYTGLSYWVFRGKVRPGAHYH